MAFKAGKRAFHHCFSGKILSPEVWGKNGKDWVLIFLLSSRRQVVEMYAAIFEEVGNN